jgi:1,4-dihydroxy-2-naphthoate octaprenyltransferase
MKHWIQAFRLRTLPLAVSSILVGSALAHFRGAFSWAIFGLALLTAILLQLLSNLANDLGDHEHGTDNVHRVGPLRSVQSGAISAASMKRAMVICGALALLSGLALIFIAFGSSLTTVAFLLIGLAAIGAAVKYTFGKNPYGYAGLGDLSVFLFFGVVGVAGTFYLYTQSFDAITLRPIFIFGFLSAAVLNVNNMRDIENDRASGKRTLVVRLGLKNALHYHFFLVFIPFMLLTRLAWPDKLGPWMWLALIGYIPPMIHLFRIQHADGKIPLDPELKRVALGTFFTAILFSLGLILA